MKIVGLTGGIGSGKSTVVRLFGELGVHWVDADNVAREVVERGTPALAAVAEHFGDNILTREGDLDRARLRQIIFEFPEERRWLEALLHPIIRDELTRQLMLVSGKPSYHFPYVLLVSPLLFETDQHQLVDHSLVVDVPVDTQIARTMSRDNNSRKQIERIIAAQMPRNERVAKANSIIDNTCPLEEVQCRVQELHNELLVNFA
ncbi:MAG TPA: dephospho-CoA kinase [Marinobacter sp.]|nr:dephospho-CoA kinase [Marinobacter sp.]